MELGNFLLLLLTASLLLLPIFLGLLAGDTLCLFLLACLCLGSLTGLTALVRLVGKPDDMADGQLCKAGVLLDKFLLYAVRIVIIHAVLQEERSVGQPCILEHTGGIVMLAADGEILLEVFLCHVQHEVATVGDAAFTYQVMVAVGILLGEGDDAKVLGAAEADTDDQAAVAFLVYLRTEAVTALVAGDIL